MNTRTSWNVLLELGLTALLARPRLLVSTGCANRNAARASSP